MYRLLLLSTLRISAMFFGRDLLDPEPAPDVRGVAGESPVSFPLVDIVRMRRFSLVRGAWLEGFVVVVELGDTGEVLKDEAAGSDIVGPDLAVSFWEVSGE